MKNNDIKNHQNVILHLWLAPRIIRATLLLLFALITLFIPTKADAQSVWTSQDIGTPPKPGSSILQDGDVIVSGSGVLWGTSDTCQFYYQSLNGDGQIVAYLQSETNSGKAGLMIRQSLDADSQEVCILMSGNYGPAFEVRATTEGDTTNPAWNSGTLPAWYKLVRSGSTITGYTSPDGITWTELSSTTVSLSTPVFIGLVSSANSGNSNLTVTTFSNVTVTPYSQGGNISFDNQAGNVVSLDQTVGQTTFNTSFQQHNQTGASWTNGYGGLNLDGSVQAVDTTSAKTGYAFYDTSVIPGTGGNSGSGGTEANQFQYGYYTASFSLKNYQSSANQVGLYLIVDGGGVGSGGGYVYTVNPVQTNGNWYFQCALHDTTGYAPKTGAPLSSVTNTTPIPLSNTATNYSPFYTLGVQYTGGAWINAQIYDSRGYPFGSVGNLYNTHHYTNSGIMGFLASATNAGTGATVYKLSYTPSTTANPPRVLYVNNAYTGGLGLPNGYYNTPYTNISAGATSAVSGDIVEVAPGANAYNEAVPAYGQTNVTFRAASPWGAKVVAPSTNSCAFNIGSDVTIDGFDVSTSPTNIGTGIFSNGGTHDIVRNCYVHDCGGSGIGLANGDYRIVYNNVVARNAYTNTAADSGISFWGLDQSDTNSGYHSMVCNNICYGNDNKFTVNQGQHIYTSDGEGIIIDDNRNTQGGHPTNCVENPTYTGAYTLLANNLIFNNGGRGIQVYLSNNVDIVNNTVFQNNTRSDEESVQRGEITATDSYRVTLVNNISCSTNAPPNPQNATNTPFAVGGDTNSYNMGNYITFGNNIAYDASGNPNTPPVNTNYYLSPGATPISYSTTNGNINGVNPGFINAIGNANLQNTNIASTSDFQQYLGLTNNSPATNAATDGFIDWSGAIVPVPAYDLVGNPRPSSYGYYDIGAYEYTTTP